MSTLDKQDLKNRAMAAYFRSAAKIGGVPVQPSEPDVVDVKGLHYIVLSNTKGILAVYRVRIVNDQPVLKGLKRWPKDLDASFSGVPVSIIAPLGDWENEEISTLELERRISTVQAELKVNRALTNELRAVVRTMKK